jgi:hypothetical protein
MSKALVGAPIGADVDAVIPAEANADGSFTIGKGAPFALGTVVNGADGTRYMLVQAASTSAEMASTDAPNAYALLENGSAKLMTTTLAAAGNGLGFAPQAVIDDFDFFWARIAGRGFNARVAVAASANKFLRTTATAGRLSTASVDANVFFPAVLVTAAASASGSAGSTVREVYVSQLAPLFSGKSSGTLVPL